MLDVRSPLPTPRVPLAGRGLGSPLLQTGQATETRGGRFGVITVASNPTVTYQSSAVTVQISRAAQHMAGIHNERPAGTPGRPNTPTRGSSGEMPVRRQGQGGGFERSNTFVNKVLGGNMPMGWLG